LRLKTTKVIYHPALPFLSALFASPGVLSLSFSFNSDIFEPLINVPRTPHCARAQRSKSIHRSSKKVAISALSIPPASQPDQLIDTVIAPNTSTRFWKAESTSGLRAALFPRPSPAVLSSPPFRTVTNTITQSRPVSGTPPEMVAPSLSRTSSNSAASSRASFYLAHEALGAPNL
jgi:hypothetical protein